MIEGVRFPAEINIYGSKVALTSTFQEMVGVMVENEPIAETLKNLHHFFWNTLPDYDCLSDVESDAKANSKGNSKDKLERAA